MARSFTGTLPLVNDENEMLQQGLAHHQAGNWRQAGEWYRQVLKIKPDHTEALYLLGTLAYQTGYHTQAVQILQRALTIQPEYAECCNVLGLALSSLGQEEEAEASFRRAITFTPSAGSYNNLGILLKKQGRLDEAIAMYREALGQDPSFEDALYNLGNAHRARSEWEAAAGCFRQVIAANPDHGNALAALGQVLRTSKRAEEAAGILQRATSFLQDDPDLYCELGDTWQDLGQIQEAAAAYQKALQLDTKFSRALYSMGCMQSAAKEYITAVASFQKALEMAPNWPEAQHNLGQALFELGQVDEALQFFYEAARGPQAELPRAMTAVIIPGSPQADNQRILDVRRDWAERTFSGSFLNHPVRHGTDSSSGILRIGYISSFFHRDNWMKPVWGLINQHDRQNFEIHLFSDAPAFAIRHGYRSHPQDRFYDISGLSNEAAAEQVKRAEVDLFIDLNGYSQIQRLPLIAARPAPIIVGWFNMFATTGMACYDYLIGDAQVIPAEEEKFYCEKIARVPGSYLTFNVDYPVPDISSPPCLIDKTITFGCLAPLYKITQDVIAVWCRILQAVPQSRLILKNTALESLANRRFVHDLFQKHGVPPERVLLEGPADHYQFLETYSKVDIALDTFPYNGGTTTTEAIWQGVPVLTFGGDRWVSRTSASILRAGNLGQFVSQDVEGYINSAIQWALSPDIDYLVRLRQEMRTRLRDSPVCDTRKFAENMEFLYRQIYAEHV